MQFKEFKQLNYEEGIGFWEIETDEGETLFIVKMGRGKPRPEQIGTTCHNWKATERAGAEWFFNFQIERKRN